MKPLIRANMAGHIAYCFDFEQGIFTKPDFFEKLYESNSQKRPETDPVVQRIKQEHLQFIKDTLKYNGTDQNILTGFLEILDDSGKDLFQLFKHKEEALTELFTHLNSNASDEYFYAFESLLEMADLSAKYIHKAPKEFIKSAFQLAFPPPLLQKAKNQIKEQIGDFCKRSLNWKLDWEGDFQQFLAAFCEGIEKQDFGFNTYDLWKGAIIGAGYDDTYFSFFKALLLHHVTHQKDEIYSILKELALPLSDSWLFSNHSSTNNEEQQWYRRIASSVKSTQIQKAFKNNIPSFWKLINNENSLHKNIVFSLIREAKSNSEEDTQLLVKVYRQRPSNEIRLAYFNTICEWKDFDGKIGNHSDSIFSNEEPKSEISLCKISLKKDRKPILEKKSITVYFLLN